jgi:hypothetical protein
VGLIIPFLKEEIRKAYDERVKSLTIDPKLKAVFDAGRETVGTEYSQQPLDKKWTVPRDERGSTIGFSLDKNGQAVPVKRAPPIDCSGFVRAIVSKFDSNLSATGNVSSEYAHFASHSELYDFQRGSHYKPILSNGERIKVGDGFVVEKQPELKAGSDIKAGDIVFTGSAKPRFTLRDLKSLSASEQKRLPAEVSGRDDLAVLTTDFKHIAVLTGRKVGQEYEAIEASDTGTVAGFFTHNPSEVYVLVRPKV